jgi:hypothetical protein
MNAEPKVQAIFTLDTLKAAWRKAKADEETAKEHRLAIENRILAVLGDMVPEEGSVSTDGVTVRTSFYRKWDQDRLTQLSEAIDPAYWPFKVEWKEDRKASRVFEERFPELWRHVANALTLTPAKPAVKVEES